MIRYLKPLFTTEKTADKTDVLKRSFREGAGAFGYFLITIASNEQDVFDIIPIPLLKQRSFRHRDYDVIGLAESKEAAYTLVANIFAQYHAQYSSYDGIRKKLCEMLCEQENET